MPTHNKPLAIMAVDVNTQASVLRSNIGDYPLCGVLKTATIASGKTLPARLKTYPYLLTIYILR